MPTTSPGWMPEGSSTSRVSSVVRGSPYWRGVAAASTYSHRGVMTPTPNARWLGLIRCNCKQTPPVTGSCLSRSGGSDLHGAGDKCEPAPADTGSRTPYYATNLLPLLIFGEDFCWSVD